MGCGRAPLPALPERQTLSTDTYNSKAYHVAEQVTTQGTGNCSDLSGMVKVVLVSCEPDDL